MEDKEPLYIKLHNWRFVPRVFSIAYLYFMFSALAWAKNLGNEISVEAAGLVATIVTAGAAWFKFYVETGPGSNKGTNL